MISAVRQLHGMRHERCVPLIGMRPGWRARWAKLWGIREITKRAPASSASCPASLAAAQCNIHSSRPPCSRTLSAGRVHAALQGPAAHWLWPAGGSEGQVPRHCGGAPAAPLACLSDCAASSNLCLAMLLGCRLCPGAVSAAAGWQECMARVALNRNALHAFCAGVDDRP